MPKVLLNKQEAADYLRISVEALNMRVKRGQIPTVRISKHRIRFDANELDKMIDEMTEEYGR